MQLNDMRYFTEFTAKNDKITEAVFQFAKYQFDHYPRSRCFYELIAGDRMQKLKFDIDIHDVEDLDASAQRAIDALMDRIPSVFEQMFRRQLDIETDVLLFTSHSPQKRSFHIVIDNYVVEKREIARDFYDRATEGMDEELLSFIDDKVYSSRQQFRIVGSEKQGSGRPKVLQRVWKHHDKTIHHRFCEEDEEMYCDGDDWDRTLVELTHSIVSNTSGCILVNTILPLTRRVYTRSLLEVDDIGEDMAHDACEKTKNVLDHFPYKMNGIIGEIVILRRTRPDYCDFCKKVHEHENAFLTVRPEGNEYTVMFYCRRGQERGGKLIGRYLSKAEAENAVAEIPMIPTSLMRQPRKSES